jgi:hypothetical protein
MSRRTPTIRSTSRYTKEKGYSTISHILPAISLFFINLVQPMEDFLYSVLDSSTHEDTPIHTHCVEAIKRTFLLEGYTDTSYLAMIKEKDLKDFGLMESLEGKSLCKKLLKSLTRLPKAHVPRTVPRSVSTWLRGLQLFRYRMLFAHRGIGDADVDLLQGITEKDLKAMGIEVSAHRRKLKESLEKISQLFKEGIAPEGRFFKKGMDRRRSGKKKQKNKKTKLGKIN